MRSMLQSRSSSSRSSRSPGAVVTLPLSAVGCTACAVAVRQNAEADVDVLACDVDIDKALAHVTLAAGADQTALRQRLLRRLALAGYAEQHNAEPPAADAGGTPSAVTGRQVGEVSGGASLCCDRDAIGGVVGGLVGSSCCALQLCINALAALGFLSTAGCAGFNTILGPVRPYTRAATATFFAVRLARCALARRPRLIRITVLTALLTFLPEILRATSGVSVAPPTAGAVRLSLRVDGMGCEACQLAVQGAMQRTSGVLAAAADFEAGTATVLVNEQWGFELAELTQRVAEAGFEVHAVEAAS